MFNLFHSFKKKDKEIDAKLAEQKQKVVKSIKDTRLELELAIEELKKARKSSHV